MIEKIKSLIPNSLRKKIFLLRHKGNNFECPFCGYKAKDLEPIGDDIKVLKEKNVIGSCLRHAGCYNCGSIDRERLIYIYLKDENKILEKSKNLSVLHIAPEKFISDKFLKADFKEYICGDLFTEGYSYPEHVKNINVLDIPFEDNRFDIVICNHVLEHVDDDARAMKEIQRVLKVGGFAILQVPISKNSNETYEDFSITDPNLRKKAFGQFDHVRIYGQDYKNRLENCGFKVEILNISEKYIKYGLNKEENLYICHK